MQGQSLLGVEVQVAFGHCNNSLMRRVCSAYCGVVTLISFWLNPTLVDQICSEYIQSPAKTQQPEQCAYPSLRRFRGNPAGQLLPVHEDCAWLTLLQTLSHMARQGSSCSPLRIKLGLEDSLGCFDFPRIGKPASLATLVSLPLL